jgi:hypothetical protein
MRSLLLPLTVVPLFASIGWSCTADMTCGVHPGPDPAVIRSCQAGGWLPGGLLATHLVDVDGQRLAVQFEHAARVTPGHHTARFLLLKDESDWSAIFTWKVILESYLAEVHFVARPGGRYVLRGEAGDFGPDVRMRAWLEDEAIGREVAEARLMELEPGETLDEAIARLRAEAAAEQTPGGRDPGAVDPPTDAAYNHARR